MKPRQTLDSLSDVQAQNLETRLRDGKAELTPSRFGRCHRDVTNATYISIILESFKSVCGMAREYTG